LGEGEQVEESQGGEGGRLWLHFAFGAAYAVLLLRLLPLVLSLPPDDWVTQAAKFAGNVFAGHFGYGFSVFDDDPRILIPHVVMTFTAYGATHYAAASGLPEDEGDSRMLKFMYFCRSLLYLFVTLLVVLVIVRMFILVYQDLSAPRYSIIRGGVRAPAR
jgi:hypothetical protein